MAAIYLVEIFLGDNCIKGALYVMIFIQSFASTRVPPQSTQHSSVLAPILISPAMATSHKVLTNRTHVVIFNECIL